MTPNPESQMSIELRAIDASDKNLLLPVAKIESLVQSMRIFEKVKSQLLTNQDLYTIRESESPKIRASGWRKLALAFGISDEITREERVVDPSDPAHIMYRFEVRAYTQANRVATGVGSASSKERKFQHEEHDLRALAHTRAKSRAIRDLLGGSDSIAEEDSDLGASQPAIGYPSYSKAVPQTPDADKIRAFWAEHIGDEMASKLKITMTGGGPEVLLSPPVSIQDSKKFLAFAWECDYAVTEDSQGIKCKRKSA